MVSFLRFNNENEEQVRKPIAEGDALWDAGDKANAVKKYEVVLGDKFDLYGKKADRPRIYGRLIEYAHQQEKAEEVSHLVTKADQKGITPTINDPAVQRRVRSEGEGGGKEGGARQIGEPNACRKTSRGERQRDRAGRSIAKRVRRERGCGERESEGQSLDHRGHGLLG